ASAKPSTLDPSSRRLSPWLRASRGTSRRSYRARDRARERRPRARWSVPSPRAASPALASSACGASCPDEKRERVVSWARQRPPSVVLFVDLFVDRVHGLHHYGQRFAPLRPTNCTTRPLVRTSRTCVVVHGLHHYALLVVH